jgi:2-iminobutanoate/2-iminopropanoate deaminase
MPKKEIITCPDVPAGSNPLSQGTRFGDMLFIQGCTGRHPTTGAVGKDIREQTQFALDRIKAILEAGGSSLDDVLTNTCYVSNREDLPGFNEVYAKFFTHDWPARTTIIVNFGDPNNLVEITSTACIPG